MEWQKISKIAGGSSLSILAIIVLVLNLSGMSYNEPPDIYCEDACYSEIQVNSSYWNVKVEHAGLDEDIIFKKSTHGRTLYLNLDKIDNFAITNPEVPVQLLIPTTKKYAMFNHPEYGYLRTLKDGDYLIQRKSSYNPDGSRFVLLGVKSPEQTVKWSFLLDTYLSGDINIDPKWIGEEKIKEEVNKGQFAENRLIKIQDDPYINCTFDDMIGTCMVTDKVKLLETIKDIDDITKLTNDEIKFVQTNVFEDVPTEIVIKDELGKDEIVLIYEQKIDYKDINGFEFDASTLGVGDQIRIGFATEIYELQQFDFGNGTNVSIENHGVMLDNPHADADESIVAWYRFDEDARDYSGNGYDGTVTGAVHNYSFYEFDGDTDFIHIDDFENYDNY